MKKYQRVRNWTRYVAMLGVLIGLIVLTLSLNDLRDSVDDISDQLSGAEKRVDEAREEIKLYTLKAAKEEFEFDPFAIAPAGIADSVYVPLREPARGNLTSTKVAAQMLVSWFTLSFNGYDASVSEVIDFKHGGQYGMAKGVWLHWVSTQ